MEIIHKFKSASIKPIIGLDLDKILLYVMNEEGYYNLVKIETLKNKGTLDIECLKNIARDLFVFVLIGMFLINVRMFMNLFIWEYLIKKKKSYFVIWKQFL